MTAQGTPADMASAVARLAAARPELGLERRRANPALQRLDRIEALDRWLDDTATLAAGMDRRTAAAYLLSILVWRLGDILGALYLQGMSVSGLRANHIRTELSVTGSGRTRDIGFRFALEAPPGGNAFDQAGFGEAIVDIHGPLVTSLHAATGLPRNALWRLVADGMSAGLLAHGKLVGDLRTCRQEAAAVLQSPPLHNGQWAFIEVSYGPRTEWYRLRGGCCRLYKSAGGELCTTCVLRTREDQVARLEAHLRGRT